MALTTYAGVTKPAIVSTATGGPASDQFNNTNQTMPSTSPSAPDFSASAIARLSVGDKILVFIYMISSTASVNSISLTTTTGITFSRLGSQVTSATTRMEVWVSTASPTSQAVGDLTANLSASVDSALQAFIVTNTPTFVNPTSNTAAATTAWSLTLSATTVQNNLAIVCVGSTDAGITGTDLTNRSTPSTISSSGRYFSNPLGTTVSTMCVIGDIEGSGITPTVAGVLGASSTYIAMGVIASGPTIQLDDLTYKFRDDGILLNGPTSVPLYDITNVAGLQDSIIQSQTDQVDGTNGSNVSAKFLSGKTVVLDGNLITSAPVDETLIDNLKYNYRPITDFAPFFYKKNNTPPRQLFAKPVGFHANEDRGFAIGTIPFQLQLQSGDVIAYSASKSSKQDTQNLGTTFAMQITPGGNIETFPTVYFNVYSGEPSATLSFGFQAVDWGNVYYPGSTGLVQIKGVSLPLGHYKLDLKSRRLTRLDDNSDQSQFISTRQWFGLIPNKVNNIWFTRPTGSAVTNEGFTIVYGDGWR